LAVLGHGGCQTCKGENGALKGNCWKKTVFVTVQSVRHGTGGFATAFAQAGAKNHGFRDIGRSGLSAALHKQLRLHPTSMSDGYVKRRFTLKRTSGGRRSHGLPAMARCISSSQTTRRRAAGGALWHWTAASWNWGPMGGQPDGAILGIPRFSGVDRSSIGGRWTHRLHKPRSLALFQGESNAYNVYKYGRCSRLSGGPCGVNSRPRGILAYRACQGVIRTSNHEPRRNIPQARRGGGSCLATSGPRCRAVNNGPGGNESLRDRNPTMSVNSSRRVEKDLPYYLHRPSQFEPMIESALSAAIKQGGGLTKSRGATRKR